MELNFEVGHHGLTINYKRCRFHKISVEVHCGGGQILKRVLIGVLAVVMLSSVSVPAQAGYFDFALWKSRHSVSVNLDVEDFDLAVLITSQGSRSVVPLDSKGDMKSIGDFKLEETGRSYSGIGVGYKLGPATPFIGYATRAVSTVERVVVENEITKMNEVVSRSAKANESGLLFGVGLEVKVQRVGMLATLAKAPSGFYCETNIKYYFNDHLALIGGYLYHPGVNANGVMLGLGVSY